MTARPVAPRARRAPASPRGLVWLGGSLLGLTLGVLAAEPVPDAPRLLDWVRELSSPAMDGRAAGTPGADRASRYLADHFRRIGLGPLGDGGTPFQRFALVTGVRLGEGNALEAVISGATRRFAIGPDVLPFAFSDDGQAAAEVVFAGYGITAPPLGWDDYAGVDVRGRIVLVMTGEPQEGNPQGPFRPAEYFHYTELRHKVLSAREHGAVGIIVVEHPGRPHDAPRPIRGTTPAWGILAVSARRAVADALLAPAGRSLIALQAEIDRRLAPASRALPGVRVGIAVTLLRDRGETANVVGLLPGTDPALRDEAVVIGAHYDHLGRGGAVSLDPIRADLIHPGADDNASGTAAVVALGEAFQRSGGARRSLVFVAFSGEEAGLLGSSHYVQHPPVPLERTRAMLNLDMVGRLREDRLHVSGVDTGQGLRALVEREAAGLGLRPKLRGDGVAPSDHTPFLLKSRPVLFFFTGVHGDYHRPGDTWDKINAEGLRKVATLAFRIARALANDPDPMPFVQVAAAPGSRREAGRGYGPYFGIVPDFGEGPTPGVRLGGVRPGSPAERAGLREGDVIRRFAGVLVRTLDDLTFALRQRRPGDVVEVTFTRGDTERTVEATLEQRR